MRSIVTVFNSPGNHFDFISFLIFVMMALSIVHPVIVMI